MIALKMPVGMSFGRVRKVSVSRILFEMDTPVQIGQHFEWRMELTGWNATILGRLVIRRLKPRDERPDLVEARIVHIDGKEARLFQDWLTELSVGGTTRRYEVDPSSVAGVRRGKMSGASRVETQSVLNRMDKRIYGKSSVTGSTSDSYGLNSMLSSTISGVEEGASGRQAMSAALKAGLKGGGRRGKRIGSDLPVVPPIAEFPRIHTEKEIFELPPSHVTSASLPEIQILANGGPIRVKYLDSSSFHSDWIQHMQRSGLFIHEKDLGTVGSVRDIELLLPSGKAIRCTAQIVAPMPTGTGLALRLQPSQLRRLREEASNSTP
jgi:hypothetical protein